MFPFIDTDDGSYIGLINLPYLLRNLMGVDLLSIKVGTIRLSCT